MSEKNRLAELLYQASMNGGLAPRSAGDCLDSVETAYDVQRIAGTDGRTAQRRVEGWGYQHPTAATPWSHGAVHCPHVSAQLPQKPGNGARLL